MTKRRRKKRTGKNGTWFTLVGSGLVLAALLLTAYNLYDSHRAGIRAEDALEALVLQIEQDPVPTEGRMTYVRPADADRVPEPGESQSYYEDEVEYPDYVLDAHKDMPVKRINGRDYIGTVSIPSIDRELPVFSEWNYPNLRIGPCRYEGSVYLDNMVVCAHNYAIHFGELKNLSYGDTVIFTDMDGNVFQYMVKEIVLLLPSEIEAMTTGDWDLTLFTCTIGGRQRVTVRCERVPCENDQFFA